MEKQKLINYLTRRMKACESISDEYWREYVSTHDKACYRLSSDFIAKANILNSIIEDVEKDEI